MRNVISWGTVVIIAMILSFALISSISVISVALFGYTEGANCLSICIFLLLYCFIHKRVYFDQR